MVNFYAQDEVCVCYCLHREDIIIIKFHPQEGFCPAGSILILKTKIIIAA